MRTPLLSLLSPLLVVTALGCVGCGGGGGGAGPKGPEGERAGALPEGGEGEDGDAAAAPTGAETTTTTELGKGGDLQGAKLGEQVRTTTETKGEGGPKSTGGQSAGEPGRTAKDIAAIVAARRDEARACYDKALAAHPGIKGDLDIKWVIDPQGNVSEASVDTTKSTILEPGVGACVVDIIKTIKFAPSDKGYETRAHYPFNFNPKASSGKATGK